MVDLGLTTTPTVEIAVKEEEAAGGIILTASHNPQEWNALKLLNNEGEFLNAEAGEKVLSIAESEKFDFVPVNKIGKYKSDNSYLQKHIDAVVNYDLVDVEAIKKAKFKIVVDPVNSSGSHLYSGIIKSAWCKRYRGD